MQVKCKQRETQDSRLAFPQRPAARRGPCSVDREPFSTSVLDREPAPLGNLFIRLTGTQQPVVKVTRAALRALGPTEQRLAAPEIRRRALHATGRKRRVTLCATDIFVPKAVLTLLPTVTGLFLRSDRLFRSAGDRPSRRLCRSSEEIDPDRRPPHFAPSDRRSPPRLPRDFHHGLLRPDVLALLAMCELGLEHVPEFVDLARPCEASLGQQIILAFLQEQ